MVVVAASVYLAERRITEDRLALIDARLRKF